MAVKSKISKTSKVNPLVESLNELIHDQNIPGNIQDNAIEIFNIFSNENGSIEQRKSKAIQILEQMISDDKIDAGIRTKLFSTITLVESLSSP